MKVDLEKIRLGHSPLTDSIFAGTIIKEGIWRNKVNVTDDFISCVINRWVGSVETFSAGDNEYEISVKKIK